MMMNIRVLQQFLEETIWGRFAKKSIQSVCLPSGRGMTFEKFVRGIILTQVDICKYFSIFYIYFLWPMTIDHGWKMKQRQHVSAKIKQHWMVDNCRKVRGHKLEALLQKGRQLLATAPLSTLGCPFSEMRKAARERLVGGNLVRHRLAADSGRERERERAESGESAGALLAYNPPCVTTTPRPPKTSPGDPESPRGTGISGLLHQSEQSSQHDLSWKILSKPSRTKAVVEMI